MTDSVAITLDLTKLPPEQRQRIPVIVGTDVDQDGEIYRRGIKPLKLRSPLVPASKMMWIVRAGQHSSLPGMRQAESIDADLNIPNALVGQNLQHGTSVFAACVAALWLLKIWLAEQGVSRDALDLLGVDAVKLRRATVTYLMPMASPEAARQLVADIQQTALILNKKTVCFESTNKTVKVPTKAGQLVAYAKTLLTHCSWPADAPIATITAWNERVVRLEAVLNGDTLKALGMQYLECWRAAYEQGVYERVFKLAVVEPLRVDLRHNYPRQEVFDNLTPTEAAFLKWYLDGNDPRQFASVAGSKEPVSTYWKLRHALLAFQIDVSIPWEDHVRLRGHVLRDVLVYPGDHTPSDEVAPWCFCQSNWPSLLQLLVDKFTAVLARWQPGDEDAVAG